MDIKVHKRDGSESGATVTLEESVFGIEPNEHAVWLDVRRVQAHMRQGTHKSKERSETRGSTRKLYRQKGTGNARAGDAKSPLRRSGGTFFGPRPHEYRLKINRKTSRLARRSALSSAAADGSIRIVEDFSFEAPSTRELRDFVAAFELQNQKVLVLTSEYDEALYRSGRNLRKVAIRKATDASTVDLLDAQVILIQKAAVDALVDNLAPVAAHTA